MNDELTLNNRREIVPDTSSPVSNESYIESKTKPSSMKSKDLSMQLEEDVRIIAEYKLKRTNPLYRLQKRIPRERKTKHVSYRE